MADSIEYLDLFVSVMSVKPRSEKRVMEVGWRDLKGVSEGSTHVLWKASVGILGIRTYEEVTVKPTTLQAN